MDGFVILTVALLLGFFLIIYLFIFADKRHVAPNLNLVKVAALTRC